MITTLMIALALVQSTPAPPPQTPQPSPAIELLKTQLAVCAKYTNSDDDMKQLLVDLENAKNVSDVVKWDTLKICIAFRQGRLYQHGLDTRV